jgi:hypothetical protein
MLTQVSTFAPPNVRLRSAPTVSVLSAEEVARAELRRSLADAIAKGRKALVGARP